jgi:hypothetical protein
VGFSPEVEAWRARGKMTQARNIGVFVVDEGQGRVDAARVADGFERPERRCARSRWHI